MQIESAFVSLKQNLWKPNIHSVTLTRITVAHNNMDFN